MSDIIVGLLVLVLMIVVCVYVKGDKDNLG